jgi:hypothetical protein
MPNWCVNQLTVRGPSAELARFKSQAVGHYPWSTAEERGAEPPNPLNFHSLVPIPEEILRSAYNDAAYNWEKENWGNKWGACDVGLLDEWPESLVYSFNTAWSPPIAFLQKVCRQWPVLTFILEYDEPGIGFKGLARGHGEEFEDHCVDY